MPGPPTTRPRGARAARTGSRPVPGWLLVAGLLTLALNLRAALSGYPPLLPAVRDDLGLSSGAAGLPQTAAVLAMAAGSFGGIAVTARFGAERTLGAAVAVVGVGSLLRGLPAAPALFGGTALIGLGMGVAGVGLAGVVRGRFPDRAGTLSGAYVVAMLVGATAAGGLAVPLAGGLGGWAPALAVWALPAFVSATAWAVLTGGASGSGGATGTPPGSSGATGTPSGSGGATGTPSGSGAPVRTGDPDPGGRVPSAAGRPPMTRRGWTPMAVWAAVYQAGTSMIYYGWLTWLAPYYQDQGWSPARTGLLTAVFSLAQVPTALLLPTLAERHRHWGRWTGLAVAVFAVGTAGTILVPQPPLVGPWLWVTLIGLGGGAMFPLGMTIIAWRSADAAEGAAVSGRALGAGYTVAALGPFLIGVLVDAGGYPVALTVLLVAAAAQALAATRLRLPRT